MTKEQISYCYEGGMENDDSTSDAGPRCTHPGCTEVALDDRYADKLQCADCDKILCFSHLWRGEDLSLRCAECHQAEAEANELPEAAYDADNFRDLGGMGAEPR